MRGTNAPEYRLASEVASTEVNSTSTPSHMPSRLPRYSLDDTLRSVEQRRRSAAAAEQDEAAQMMVSSVDSNALHSWAISTFVATNAAGGPCRYYDPPSPRSLASIAGEGISPSVSRVATPPALRVDGVLLSDRQVSKEITSAVNSASSSVKLWLNSNQSTTDLFDLPSAAVTGESGDTNFFQQQDRVATVDRRRRSAQFTRCESLIAMRIARNVNTKKNALKTAAKRRAEKKGLFEYDTTSTDEAERSDGSKLIARKGTLAKLTGETNASPADNADSSLVCFSTPQLERSISRASTVSMTCASARGLEKSNSRAGAVKNKSLAAKLARNQIMAKQSPLMSRMDSCSSAASSAMVREDSINSVGIGGQQASPRFGFPVQPSVGPASPMIRENSTNSIGSFPGTNSARAAPLSPVIRSPVLHQTVAPGSPMIREDSTNSLGNFPLRNATPRVASSAEAIPAPGSPMIREDSTNSSIGFRPRPPLMRKPVNYRGISSDEESDSNSDQSEGRAAILNDCLPVESRRHTESRFASVSRAKDNTSNTSLERDSPLLIAPDSPFDRFTSSLRNDPSFAPSLLSSTLLTPLDGVPCGHTGEDFEEEAADQAVHRILRNVRDRVQTPLDFHHWAR